MAAYNEELTKDFFTELSPDDADYTFEFMRLGPMLPEAVILQSLLPH